MQQLSWKDKLKVIGGRWLVRTQRLTHSAFTVAELNALVRPHFPCTMPIEVPVGMGSLTLMEAELSLNDEKNRIELELLADLRISVKTGPLYQAHLLVLLSATPAYLVEQKTVVLGDVSIDNILLVNDDYALITDTSSLLNSLGPLPVGAILGRGLKGPIGSTVKGVLNLFTAGMSEHALNYLRLYLDGSKQRVLDYHRAELEQKVKALVIEENIHYTLDASDWQEWLFCELGREVVVEQQELRFKF
jgi:hypothetical protein